MKLAKYLTRNILTPRQFAELANVDLTTVQRWLRGTRPTCLSALSIERATNGAVTYMDFASVAKNLPEAKRNKSNRVRG